MPTETEVGDETAPFFVFKAGAFESLEEVAVDSIGLAVGVLFLVSRRELFEAFNKLVQSFVSHGTYCTFGRELLG